MDKTEKEIVKHLVQKELKCIKHDEKSIEFPSLEFLKAADKYEVELKKLLKKLG